MALPPQDRVLRRSAEDFYLLGVCGGLGRYFGVDPGAVRLLALVLAPVAWLPYMLAPLVLPAERPGDELGPPTPRMRARARSRAIHAGGPGAVLGSAVRRHVLRRS